MGFIWVVHGIQDLDGTQPGKSWIQTTFYKRECVKFLPASRDHHRCSPVCHVCQNLVRCCCGRLIGEHAELDSASPVLPSSSGEELWSVARHTRVSPTDAFGSIDFQDSTKRSCRAKYVRLSCDAKPEQLLCLMLREWNMVQPKLVISVHGGTENFPLPPRVGQAFSKGLIRAAETTGAWIFTDGFNTGVSMYVGDGVKVYGTHERRKRNIIGITPWGFIENHSDLIGRDVLRHYQTLGNPLSKRSSLNGLHSHFLLVDDGTLGKSGGQLDLRRKLERHIHRQRIHPRLAQRVPVVCVVVEGGPHVLATVLEYVSRSPPVPVIVFEGTGRAADLLALIHKQTAVDRKLDVNIKEDFLLRIQAMFGVARPEAAGLFGLLADCMEHRGAITVFDSELEDHLEADVAILKASLKGTPAEQLSVTLAWDRADIAQEHILVYGQHWKVGALEQAMLNALLLDRVSFVKLLIDNGMSLKHFLTVSRLEELYNTQQSSSDHFLHHLVEDAKKCRLPAGYKISLIDIGIVIEHLIGGAYRSTYRRKSFRVVYNRIHTALKEGRRERSGSLTTPSTSDAVPAEATPPRSHFFRTAEPYRLKERPSVPHDLELETTADLGDSSLFVYSVNDLFVWAVLKRRQQMALFLWHHGEQAMARAVVACRLYRAMATEAKESDMGDSTAEELKKYSLEFGQLAVDLLDKAFKENECMAMKLLTSEMTDWSNFTCLQMAVASGLRPFLAHSCTQMLLNDLWMGRLNMRKNSWLKTAEIIACILLPVAIQLLEFKSQAEMSHVPQTQEALQFGRDAESPGAQETEEAAQADQSDAEKGRSSGKRKSTLSAWWLPLARKVYDFYHAPVVKFWFHTMSYLVFLMLYAYTVLVKMEKKPSAPEWLVISYILSTAVEKAREVLVSEPRKFRKKIKVWFSEYWNMHDFVAIVLFFTGFALRWQSGLVHTAGRIIYCLDIIFWFVRVLDLLAINQKAGPYLTMITKMMSNMFYIVVIMGIVLVSFGTPRGSVLKPYEDPSWDLLKEVLFQPYFMMFGEVYAGEINPCEEDPDCPPGSFLNPLLQAVYLFMQYIIMVNLLIAFYNNVYIHMKTMSNQLWKYNRYRYIMTYQKKPWLPPPLIIFSHMTLCVSTAWHRHKGACFQQSDSGLKLFLAPEDLKKLHEFEEKCVVGYFRDKHEHENTSQLNRIRSAADKAEEMVGNLAEVAEKVQFIQESLQMLDGHLGQLQDLSAQAVDTLNLLSATDNRQHEAVLLGHSQPIASPYQQLSHSWSLRVGGNVTPSHAPLSPKPYRSTPPSLLCGLGPVKKRPSLELPTGASVGLWDSRPRWVLGNGGGSGRASPAGYRHSHGSLPHLCGVPRRDRVSCDSSGPSCPSSPTVLWAHESYRLPSQDESMEEEEEEEEEEDNDDEEQSISRASSHVMLLSDPQSNRGRQLGIVNPAFSGDSELARPRRSRFGRRWPFPAAERELEHSRSLSASVETMAMPTAGVNTSKEDSPPPAGQKEKEWSRASGRKHSFRRKCVKIKEGEAKNLRKFVHMQDSTRKSSRKGKGLAGRRFQSSVSLTQLNFDQVDFLSKSVTLSQNPRSPTQSVWSSWARSVSGRSSAQSWVTGDVRGAMFKSTEDLDPHYSAVERNNLMRLAHTIPFTPVSLLGGEEVCIYTLEESESESTLSSTSSWSQRGRTAVLQPLAHQEALDGGLRRALRVVCTWAEGDVLKPGCVYVMKAFRAEVVRTWQREFPSSTSLHLCLREIQQQRAAQKLMQVFNEVKPSSVLHSPRFLDVSLLWWQTEGQWLTIERNMSGDFMKYNNNTGEEILPSCGLEETVLAFSHWTYEYTQKELLVLDLQGVGAELTDPSVIRADDKSSSEDLVFGPANLGDDAIQSFVLKHTCNSCCERLGLSNLREEAGATDLQKSDSEDSEEELTTSV
ncbi:transient receptor potential cation channel subfamily M member 6 [Salminus brasiliensis]|uniref:transient receptor potential cation channel subfamily M member 6 n=1 Tax=Salminus brasiliensis TaxID=930266 RepID=UPI003B837838